MFSYFHNIGWLYCHSSDKELMFFNYYKCYFFCILDKSYFSILIGYFFSSVFFLASPGGMKSLQCSIWRRRLNSLTKDLQLLSPEKLTEKISGHNICISYIFTFPFYQFREDIQKKYVFLSGWTTIEARGGGG